ncbi:MAG: aminotransferase class IV [Cyclobacteriaceae bacterium]|nr:aminotransferase class IV [Cyclobacteriaceae bacterium]
MKFILNDQIIDQQKAMIHVSDLAILRGYGIFDFFRTVGLRPLYFDDHIDRFFQSAALLRLPCPVDKIRLKSMILEMLHTNGVANSGVRIVLTGGESATGYSIGIPTLFVMNEPIGPLPEHHFTQGIKIISHEYLRDLPEIKTINYIVGIYKQPDIQAAGAVDLLYHWQGKISELTRSNFFIVDKDNTIITPGSGILKGVNRKHVITVASQHFRVVERDLYMEELADAREAFITGTTKKVMPVFQVDDMVIGTGARGPVTEELQNRYDTYLAEWIGDNREKK